jgi:hypothetical protein
MDHSYLIRIIKKNLRRIDSLSPSAAAAIRNHSDIPATAGKCSAMINYGDLAAFGVTCYVPSAR